MTEVSTISAKAKLAGIVGWPVSHSLSPRLHGFWLQHHKIDGAYVPLPVHPDNLEQALRALPNMGFRGVNLTVPHKRAAVDVVDEISDIGRRIGAVNTVFIGDGGRLSATNTDGAGFLANLHEGAPNWGADARPAVVLGAGGAARAILVSLIDAGVPEIRLLNRTRARAEEMADAFGPKIKVYDWGDRDNTLDGAGLLVNTTTLGMSGQPPLEIALDALPGTAVVTDLVYAPLETDLLAAARQRYLTAVDGLGMLLHQAVPGFEGWFGVRPEVSSRLRGYVLENA